MNIISVVEVLNSVGLGSPDLRALIPNEDNYSVLLIQPQGDIHVSAAGVRHRNQDLAAAQFRAFLEEAIKANADLTVTPEYSMPWAILVEAINIGRTPTPGTLWAIGCESIKYSDLEVIKDALSPRATMLYEPLPADPQRFVDPLAYVFFAPSVNGTEPGSIVLLVQFKTYPMGDADHFEINGLQRGTRIYKFGDPTNSLRLVSLICSDAMDFLDPQAAEVYDRALVLHIQLNPKPRQEQFRQYRSRLMRFAGDSTEIICLNWAKDVSEEQDTKLRCWKNISGSAWYLRPDKFDIGDDTLTANHKRGLYYTWLGSLRSHALFFNYEPACFLITASKVAHIGVSASISRRRGPQLTAVRTWDTDNSEWTDRSALADGFSSLVVECGGAEKEVGDLARANPFGAERVLALSAGRIGDSENWHALRNLDSCSIDASEIIRRITFCQDTEQEANDFRITRLRKCRRLWEILNTEPLPAALADFKAGLHLCWSANYPHQNVVSSQGRRATAIYLGEDVNESQIDAVAKRAAENLHRGSRNPNQSDDDRQRLHIWYRNEAGELELLDKSRYLNYDDPRSSSEFDITRAR